VGAVTRKLRPLQGPRDRIVSIEIGLPGPRDRIVSIEIGLPGPRDRIVSIEIGLPGPRDRIVSTPYRPSRAQLYRLSTVDAHTVAMQPIHGTITGHYHEIVLWHFATCTSVNCPTSVGMMLNCIHTE